MKKFLAAFALVCVFALVAFGQGLPTLEGKVFFSASFDGYEISDSVAITSDALVADSDIVWVRVALYHGNNFAGWQDAGPYPLLGYSQKIAVPSGYTYKVSRFVYRENQARFVGFQTSRILGVAEESMVAIRGQSSVELLGSFKDGQDYWFVLSVDGVLTRPMRVVFTNQTGKFIFPLPEGVGTNQKVIVHVATRGWELNDGVVATP